MRRKENRKKLDMRPAFAVDDACNGCSLNIVASSDLPVRILPGCSKATNFKDVGNREFSTAIVNALMNSYAKDLKCMAAIFRVRHPFQIFKTIIAFVSVLVIAYKAAWARAYKCLKYHLVSFNMLDSDPVGKSILDVTSFQDFRGEYAPDGCASALADAFNASEIANLVKGFVTEYVFPNFVHHSSKKKSPLAIILIVVTQRIANGDRNTCTDFYPLCDSSIVP